MLSDSQAVYLDSIKPSRLFFKSTFLYLSSILITCLILGWMLYSKGFDIHIPLGYELDGLFSSAMVKSISDTGWFLANPNLGAPFVFNSAEYPMADGSTFLIIRLLSFFTHDYAVLINLFYFLTFPLTTVAALFVFRRLGINPILSLVASILFCFIPYHYMRGEGHLLLTTLYVIPIYVLLIVSVFCENKKFNALSLLFYSIVCLFAASAGVYYAFFACYFLLIAGGLASLFKRNWRPVLTAGIFIGMIAVASVINVLPSVISHHKYGKNAELAKRVPSESELAGLKIAQMLLPINTHHIHPFKNLRKEYDSTAHLVTENSTATLGLIGSIGFLILLGLIFVREKILSDKLYIISRLSVAGVLLATIGGFGTLFNYLVSPNIRSYNRISVFIAFFALYAFFYWLQNYLKKRGIENKKTTYFIIAALLLFFGITDQVGTPQRQDYQATQKAFENDANFIAAIEEKMPAGSMIFQLPVAIFPENPAVYHMSDYQHFRGYLHSHHLHWSYGAMRGRRVIQWQEEMETKPVKEMLDNFAYAGFTGIYINRDGYKDDGKKLEEQLTEVLNEKPITSEDGRLLFFDMRSYVLALQKSMLSSEWQKTVEQTNTDLHLELRWFSGFYKSKTSSHWGKDKGTIRIVNTAEAPMKVKINFKLQTDYANKSHVDISGDLLQQDMIVNNKPVQVTKEFMLAPGPHYLHFKTNAEESNSHPEMPRARFKVSGFEVFPQ